MEGMLRARFAAERLRAWHTADHPTPPPAEAPSSGDRARPSLRRAASSSLALPLDDLVAALGLTVATFSAASQPAGTLGYLEPGEDLIFLRAGLSQAVRRFTLAHELGHAVLHRPGGAAAEAAGLSAPTSDAGARCEPSDLALPFDLVSASDEQLSPSEAYSARSVREAEANAFAAALLLPTQDVVATYLANPRFSVRTLAGRFGVSEDVLLRRLTALLVPTADEAQALPVRGGVERAVTRDVTSQLGRQEASSAGARGASAMLDACQLEAAHAPTPALVIAGPGTGKTSTLVERVAYLVRDGEVPADAILALTFSNKAAREMRARVSSRLADERDVAPGEAETGMEALAMATVSTIHTFCGMLLRRFAPLVGLRPDFQLVTEAEGYFILRELAPRLNLAHYQPVTSPSRYYPDLLAAISRAKDELVGPGKYALLVRRMAERATTSEDRFAAARAAEVATAYAAYQDALERQGDPDFGDVVRLAVRLLAEHPEVLAQVRAQYREVLVDEFQDINRAMGTLLRTLCGPAGPLWAVGDPDQAIYRFRGASPANIMRFGEDYPASVRLPLDRNHRSTPPILHAASGVARAFLGSDRPPLQATRDTADHAPNVTLATAPDEASEWVGIAAAIRQAQASGYSLSDQGVLCRTRRQAQRLAATLEAEGIATRTLAPLLEQPDVLGILGVVNLLADRSGAGLLRAGELASHRFSPEEARALLAEARARDVAPVSLLASAAGIPGISPEGARGMASLHGILARLRSAPDVATGLARYIFRLTNLGRGLLGGLGAGDPAECERAQHVGRLLALARSFAEVRRAVGERVVRGARWGEFLDYARVLLLLRQERGAGENLVASAADGVWVLTVHASKGLEFPVVYLPGLSSRRFPIQRQADVAPAPPGMMTDFKQPGMGDPHLAEEASLFYVAVTRARDRLVMSYADRYGAVRGTASPFIGAVAYALGVDLHRERWMGLPKAKPVAEPVSMEAHESSGDLARTERQSQRNDEGTTDAAAPVSVSEIETYLRCPRQYAYQHIYGLHPRDAGAVALRRTMRATLRELAASVPAERGVPMTLAEVRALFDHHWAEHVIKSPEGEAGEHEAQPPATEDTPSTQDFGALYRRHGHQAIERAWRAMIEQAAPPAFDEDVRVRFGAHEVVLPIDRIERVPIRAPAPEARGVSGLHNADLREAAAGGYSASAGDGVERGEGAAPKPGEPLSTATTRLVRQRPGRAADRPDVRAFLYQLAAEESPTAGTAHVYHEDLATGQMERVTLTSRQIERLRADVEHALAGIQAGVYPANRNAHTCAGCPFVLICPA